MTAKRGLNMPNESAEHRAARDALLREEIELRRHLERVAAQRGALPPGGNAIDDEFDGEQGPVRLSQMFEPGKDLVYSSGGNDFHPDYFGRTEWNLLDLTPEGRGGDWGPKLTYP